MGWEEEKEGLPGCPAVGRDGRVPPPRLGTALPSLHPPSVPLSPPCQPPCLCPLFLVIHRPLEASFSLGAVQTGAKLPAGVLELSSLSLHPTGCARPLVQEASVQPHRRQSPASLMSLTWICRSRDSGGRWGQPALHSPFPREAVTVRQPGTSSEGKGLPATPPALGI